MGQERRQTSVGIKCLGDEGRPGDGSPGLSVVSDVCKGKCHHNILDGLKADDSGEAVIIREIEVLLGAVRGVPEVGTDLIILVIAELWMS